MLQSLPPSLLGSTALELQPELPVPMALCPSRAVLSLTWCLVCGCALSLFGGCTCTSLCIVPMGVGWGHKDNVSAAQSPPNTLQPDPTSGQTCKTLQNQSLIPAPTPAPAGIWLQQAHGMCPWQKLRCQLGCWGSLGSRSLKIPVSQPWSWCLVRRLELIPRTPCGRDGWEPHPPWMLPLLPGVPQCSPEASLPSRIHSRTRNRSSRTSL